MYGLAFDIGTTTLAASLVEVATGVRLARAGSLNPQRKHGADVITRLETACTSAEALHDLSQLVRDALRQLADDVLAGTDAPPAAIRMALAGNPAMEHLLLGLPVESLARVPYRSLFSGGRTICGTDLGWDLPADGYLFPLPGAFVGGDMVAFLYGVGVASGDPGGRPRLYLDLGTNGEIALTAGGKVYTTSAAAGPAFEGGNLSCGMAALPGAIDGVEIAQGKVTVSTVGGLPPAGICGSAVIQCIALLLRHGVIDPTGRLLSSSEIPTNLANRVREVGGQLAFVLHHDARRLVCLTQEDIRQVQLAKGAVRAGMEVLAKRADVSWDSLDDVVVTGSFGSRLKPAHLQDVGLFTPAMTAAARFVEDGALAGVERSLCEPDGFMAVERLSAACIVAPLSGNPVFEREFLSHMNFCTPGGSVNQ